MSDTEALDYVDVVIEKLHEWGIIPEHKYGNMTEDQRHQLADLVVEKSNE